MLREDGGSAALEALLSIMIMFVAFYALWGVTVIIYNQSQITTASQLAAQTAVNDFVGLAPYLSSSTPSTLSSERNKDFVCNPDRSLIISDIAWASCYAKAQAQFVYQENTSSLLPNPFTSQKPADDGSAGITLVCTSDLTPWKTDTLSWGSCAGKSSVSAVGANFATPNSLSFLSLLQFGGGKTDQQISEGANGGAIRFLTP